MTVDRLPAVIAFARRRTNGAEGAAMLRRNGFS